jgi:hypothetical protein
MSRTRVFALAAIFFVCGMAWQYFTARSTLKTPEQDFVNRELNCSDPTGQALGKMLVTDIKPGEQFKVTTDGQDTVFDLAAQPHFSDIFEAASGSQIVLDKRMRFSGLFGGKMGVCG